MDSWLFMAKQFSESVFGPDGLSHQNVGLSPGCEQDTVLQLLLSIQEYK